MADLISKIVRSQDRVDNPYSNSQPTELTSNPHNRQFDPKTGTLSFSKTPAQVSHIYTSKELSDGYPDECDIGAQNVGEGILKTIATVIETAENEDGESLNSSTRQLNACRRV